MKDAVIRPIGHIETPYDTIRDCPRNITPDGPLCALVIRDDLIDAMYKLGAGDVILVLYWFENVDRERTRQHSKKTGEFAGVFALRTPNRPNPIGAAVVKIENIVENKIYVKGLDCLNGTPLVDIKPAKAFDVNPGGS